MLQSIDLYKSEDFDIANVAKSIHEEEEKHRYSKNYGVTRIKQCYEDS